VNNLNRRAFLRSAAIALTATQFISISSAHAQIADNSHKGILMSSSSSATARPRLRRGGTKPAGWIPQHLYESVRRRRQTAAARRHRWWRAATAADSRVASNLVRVAHGHANHGQGLHGHRGRPARAGSVRQTPRWVRRGHTRQRHRRARRRARAAGMGPSACGTRPMDSRWRSSRATPARCAVSC